MLVRRRTSHVGRAAVRTPDLLCSLQEKSKARKRQDIESKRRALLYKELEAKLIQERKEKKQLEEAQRKARDEGEDAQMRNDEETPAAARSTSLIDAIVQGQVGAAELTGLATAAPASDVEASSDMVEQPVKKRREKAVRGPRTRRKRRYFWLVLKGVRTPGMRSKLFEGDWVEQLDRYDVEQASSPEERAFMEKANEDFQKARLACRAPELACPCLTRVCHPQELKRPLPLQMRSFNDLPFLPVEHDIVYQHEDWEEDGRIAHRSLEVGDLLSGVVVDQYLHAGAFVDCCCEYNGYARTAGSCGLWPLTRTAPRAASSGFRSETGLAWKTRSHSARPWTSWSPLCATRRSTASRWSCTAWTRT